MLQTNWYHVLLLPLSAPLFQHPFSLLDFFTNRTGQHKHFTFSGVSPSHGSPSPNIRNISHLPDPQHILLHDVEVHDSRQWYPETMGHVCSDSPHAHHRSKNCPQKPFWGPGFPLNHKEWTSCYVGLPKGNQTFRTSFKSTLDITHYLC